MPEPPWSQTRPQHTSLSFLFSFFFCISERWMPIACQGSTFKESAVLKETLAANILSQLRLLLKSETKLYGKKHVQRINCTEGSICNESPACLVQSTFVPNNCSLYLCCVLHIIRCACGAHLNVGFAERSTPCRLVETLHVSCSHYKERWQSSIFDSKGMVIKKSTNSWPPWWW